MCAHVDLILFEGAFNGEFLLTELVERWKKQGDGQVVQQVLPLPLPVLCFTEVTSIAQRGLGMTSFHDLVIPCVP